MTLKILSLAALVALVGCMSETGKTESTTRIGDSEAFDFLADPKSHSEIIHTQEIQAKLERLRSPDQPFAYSTLYYMGTKDGFHYLNEGERFNATGVFRVSKGLFPIQDPFELTVDEFLWRSLDEEGTDRIVIRNNVPVKKSRTNDRLPQPEAHQRVFEDFDDI